MAREKKRPTAEQLEAEAAILKRQGAAWDLRLGGLSYRAIGKKLDCSHETVRQDIEAELQRLAESNADKAGVHRQLELERLDKYIRVLDHWIESGNIAAVGMAIKVQERRAKLLGLDAPTKQETTGTVDINITDAKSRLTHLINRTASRVGTPSDTEPTE
jgi:aryl-alcohol dehydrogenase-like predicted oxidoreductase